MKKESITKFKKVYRTYCLRQENDYCYYSKGLNFKVVFYEYENKNQAFVRVYSDLDIVGYSPVSYEYFHNETFNNYEDLVKYLKLLVRMYKEKEI